MFQIYLLGKLGGFNPHEFISFYIIFKTDFPDFSFSAFRFISYRWSKCQEPFENFISCSVGTGTYRQQHCGPNLWYLRFDKDSNLLSLDIHSI